MRNFFLFYKKKKRKEKLKLRPTEINGFEGKSLNKEYLKIYKTIGILDYPTKR